MPPQDSLAPEKVINDPAFLQLPAGEQKKVLLKVDKDFSSLPEVEQNLVIQRLHFPQPTRQQPKKAGPKNDPANIAGGFVRRAGDTASGLYHMVTDPAQTPEEYGAEQTLQTTTGAPGRLALPLYRIGSGFVDAEKQAGKQTAESARGTKQFVKDKQYGPAAVQGVKTGVTAASMLNPFATSAVANVNELQNEGRGYEATGQGLFDIMTIALGSKWAKGKIPSTGTLARLSKFAPKVIDVEGVKFVVPISEAEESAVASKAGVKQAQFKKAGIGAKEFDEINRYNQAAAREVIRKVAQDTSGMIGAMAEGAGKAVKQAGDYVLNKAKPMYKALDASMQGSPPLRIISKNMSDIVQTAMAKAEKYGAPPMAKGTTAPGMRTPPMETYLTARSTLSEIAYKTKDPLVRRGVQSALDTMNSEIEQAMKSSGVPDMYTNFKEAQRLWAKGKAIQRVSDALEKATPGVPAEKQAPGLAARNPEIKPASLAQHLNKLDASGDLTRAFGAQQKDALFHVADILDRATPVGLPAGEASLWKSIKHMAAAPYRNALVKIMTSESGAQVINNLAKARIPSQVQMYSAQLGRLAENARAQKWLPSPPGTQDNTQ